MESNNGNEGDTEVYLNKVNQEEGNNGEMKNRKEESKKEKHRKREKEKTRKRRSRSKSRK